MRIIIILIVSIVIGSCSEINSDRESTIQFKVVKSIKLTDDIVLITVHDNFFKWKVYGELDENAPIGSNAWSSKEFPTTSSGNIIIGFELKTKSNKLISQGDISIPLKEDWAWSVEFRHSSFNPIKGCFGCYGSKSFPILNDNYIKEDTDSIYVVYGGNYISHPLIY